MVTKNSYIPERGDIIWMMFNPQAGHEQGGHRVAVVLSPKNYNKKTGLSIVCPITKEIKGYPFEVLLPIKLKTRGVILADQIKSQDWRAREASYKEKLPNNILNLVMEKLYLLLP